LASIAKSTVTQFWGRPIRYRPTPSRPPSRLGRVTSNPMTLASIRRITSAAKCSKRVGSSRKWSCTASAIAAWVGVGPSCCAVVRVRLTFSACKGFGFSDATQLRQIAGQLAPSRFPFCNSESHGRGTTPTSKIVKIAHEAIDQELTRFKGSVRSSNVCQEGKEGRREMLARPASDVRQLGDLAYAPGVLCRRP
jgi:hypothetical protein